jgi:hypothetical protein
MLIYSTPITGKTTFCQSNKNWIDGDSILIGLLIIETKTYFSNNNHKLGEQIIQYYQNGYGSVIEKVYDNYLNDLKSRLVNENILFGTRRFMWLANVIYIETDYNILTKRIPTCNSLEIVINETKAIKKWNLQNKITYLNGNYIEHFLKYK